MSVQKLDKRLQTGLIYSPQGEDYQILNETGIINHLNLDKQSKEISNSQSEQPPFEIFQIFEEQQQQFKDGTQQLMLGHSRQYMKEINKQDLERIKKVKLELLHKIISFKEKSFTTLQYKQNKFCFLNLIQEQQSKQSLKRAAMYQSMIAYTVSASDLPENQMFQLVRSNLKVELKDKSQMANLLKVHQVFPFLEEKKEKKLTSTSNIKAKKSPNLQNQHSNDDAGQE